MIYIGIWINCGESDKKVLLKFFAWHLSATYV